jgi:hypothetical protein
MPGSPYIRGRVYLQSFQGADHWGFGGWEKTWSRGAKVSSQNESASIYNITDYKCRLQLPPAHPRNTDYQGNLGEAGCKDLQGSLGRSMQSACRVTELTGTLLDPKMHIICLQRSRFSMSAIHTLIPFCTPYLIPRRLYNGHSSLSPVCSSVSKVSEQLIAPCAEGHCILPRQGNQGR